MLKLIEINKKKTVYKVFDTETGEIFAYNRLELTKLAQNQEVLGVDLAHFKLKPQKVVDIDFDIFEYSKLFNIIYLDNPDDAYAKKTTDLSWNFTEDRLKNMLREKSLDIDSLLAFDINIYNLKSADDLVIAKMLYNKFREDEIYYTKDKNTFNIYIFGDRLVFNTYEDALYHGFPKIKYIRCKSVNNKYKAILNDGSPMFKLTIER